MFKIGDIVEKKSGRPFANTLLKATIIDFGINELDPKKSEAAIFEDGTLCNLKMLKIKNN